MLPLGDCMKKEFQKQIQHIPALPLSSKTPAFFLKFHLSQNHQQNKDACLSLAHITVLRQDRSFVEGARLLQAVESVFVNAIYRIWKRKSAGISSSR